MAAVNALGEEPDFVMFTGDLTHTTDDPQRRKRLTEFKRDRWPGSRSRTSASFPANTTQPWTTARVQGVLGATHYTFDHKGVHFIALDNVSDPGASSVRRSGVAGGGSGQARQECADRGLHPPAALRPSGVGLGDPRRRQGVELLTPYANVTVFYGHIHQEHHHMTRHIPHHAAKSLIFPQPAPGSQEKRTPVPWNPAAPYSGLGIRDVSAEPDAATFMATELPIKYS